MSHPAYLRLAMTSLLFLPTTKLAAQDARYPATEPLPNRAVLRLGTTRLRPAGNVEHMAFSPDGGKLATWSSELYVNDTLSIWDVKTGQLARRVDLPGARVPSLTWLADGRGFALLQRGDDRKGPWVWEFTDAKATPKIVVRAGGGSVAIKKEDGGPIPDDESDSCYALGPDGKTLAVGRSGQLEKTRPILFRSMKAGVAVGELPDARQFAQHPDNCGRLLFTPNGKLLVAFNEAKRPAQGKQEDKQLVVVWDAITGKEVIRFTAPRPAENGNRSAAAVSNRTLAIGLEDGSTSLWDLASGKEKRLATDHVSKNKGEGYGTFAVAFAPDGKMLVTGGRDGIVKSWDLATGKALHTLKRHYSWVECLAVSPDGRSIASGAQDGLIRLWDSSTGADACPLPGHLFSVTQAALSLDGKTAVTAGWDHTVRWWDSSSGRELRKVDLPGAINGLAISPDGRTVLATVLEERLRMWDLSTGRETTPADLPLGMKVGPLTFTPDGKRLIVASGPHVSVLEWPGMKLIHALELPKPAKQPGENACLSVAVSPDGRWFVTVAERFWFREEKGLRFGYAADGVADVWDLTTFKRVRRLAEGKGCFRSATFTSDGRIVLVGAAGSIPVENDWPAQEFKGEMNLLDPIAARWLRSFIEPPPTPGAAHRYTGTTLLSPDGRTLYVSYNTGEIVGCEVATGQPRRTLVGHRGYVGTLGFRPDGRRLISGGHDTTALLWDVTLAGAAKPSTEPLTAAEVKGLWEKAATEEARGAFEAMAQLAGTPERAVELLRQQVKPLPAAPTDAEFDRIFTDLGSEVFDTRVKASRELAELGESAVPGVRKRLETTESAEVQRRARSFLDKFDRTELSPTRLRQIRAVELLEEIGSPAAKELLSDLAKGAVGGPLTLDAALALARLKRR